MKTLYLTFQHFCAIQHTCKRMDSSRATPFIPLLLTMVDPSSFTEACHFCQSSMRLHMH